MKLPKKNSDLRQRVIKFELTPDKTQKIVLDTLTYAASKLWNVANYEIMNWTRESGVPYPDWYEQKKQLKDHFWYKNLPSQTSQEVLKQLHEAWQSFYELKKTGGIENPRPPKYKHHNFTIRYLNNGFTISEGTIRLCVPKSQKSYINQKHGTQVDFLYIKIPEEYKSFKGNPKVIEIIPVPNSNKYRVNIIIELPKALYKQDNGVYMSIDLGINNLITCYASTGKSLIISGRQLLSVNRYFDKKIAHYQAIAYAQQTAEDTKHPKDTKRIRQLYSKRRKQVSHLLHAAVKEAVSFALNNDVSRIIIGDVSHIRDNKDIGKRNNQKFHKWPFARIEHLLRYKAEDKGITIIMQEESYTSQCSPYAREVSENEACKANRKHRGLYVVDGHVFNADSVGAYNILKKYLCRIGKPNPAVVGLDNPEVYHWNYHNFIGNPKPAISIAV